MHEITVDKTVSEWMSIDPGIFHNYDGIKFYCRLRRWQANITVPLAIIVT
jgi:hypothetical protein